MGALIFNGIIILVIRIALELLISLLDPRIRTNGQAMNTI
jgi:ABC-type dipeptide/oligopeptide/nickel transport system permease component